MMPPVLRLREHNVAENALKNAATWSRNKSSLQRCYDGFNFNLGFHPVFTIRCFLWSVPAILRGGPPC
jgi:hypothetical protein